MLTEQEDAIIDGEHDASVAPMSPAVVVLRWLGVLPAAVLAAVVARVVVVLGNRITMSMSGFDPNEWMQRVFIEYIGGMVMGVASVYVAAYVAPFHKRPVAGVMAALVILAAGFLLFPVVFQRQYWALFSLLCVTLGAGITAYAVISGEVRP